MAEKRLIDISPYEIGGHASLFYVSEEGSLFQTLTSRIPTVDVVPVVRCRECKYYKLGKYFMDIKFCQRLPYYAEKGGLNVASDDFCSYGEREEGADNG